MATIDSRPAVFGDRLIITGETSGAEGVDLSKMLSSIDGASVNAKGSAATITNGISGTTLNVGGACTFLVIGRR
tara:strand:+ start:1049 stop:1270 length:222 start_codon:yes stop_codon:yes gene_type:complete